MKVEHSFHIPNGVKIAVKNPEIFIPEGYKANALVHLNRKANTNLKYEKVLEKESESLYKVSCHIIHPDKMDEIVKALRNLHDGTLLQFHRNDVKIIKNLLQIPEEIWEKCS